MTPQLKMAKEFFGSLPKAPKGKQLIGIEYRQPEADDIFLMAMGEWQIAWHKYGTEKPVGIFETIPADEVKTDLTDLVGEDGQKNFYLISDIEGDEGTISDPQQSMAYYEENFVLCVMLECKRPKVGKECALRFVPVSYAAKKGYRWSHSPFTPYKQANKFV